MSELDEYFGPSRFADPETGEIKRPPRKSPDELLVSALRRDPGKQWKCEDQIKPLLTTFAELWPECVPRGSKSSLYSSARDLLPEVGEAKSEEFVRWAHNYLRRKSTDLDIKDLRSLKFLVPRWRRRKREDDPQRYVTGEYSEFIDNS